MIRLLAMGLVLINVLESEITAVGYTFGMLLQTPNLITIMSHKAKHFLPTFLIVWDTMVGNKVLVNGLGWLLAGPNRWTSYHIAFT